MVSRRRVLLAGGLLAGSAYVYQRGVRYPRMGFTPPPLSTSAFRHGARLRFTGLILNRAVGPDEIRLRAHQPEPQLIIDPGQSALTLQFDNIPRDAILKVNGLPPHLDVIEHISGIQRSIELPVSVSKQVTLQWVLPENNRVEFAAIGDTGGLTELDWCLQRAAELGARFLLHMGDFNYTEGEYDLAIRKFNNSPIPVYVSIGNHDFNQSGLIYQKFLDEVAPLNHSFVIAGSRFLNLDTAADFFPASAGNRGRLISDLFQDQSAVDDYVVFSHRPFQDTRPGEDHAIGGVGEIAWLADSLKRLGADHYLCGHVHRSSEIETHGLRQLIAGEGLGFEDIRNKKKVAQILLGTAEVGQSVSYRWASLDMPWNVQHSPKHIEKIKKELPASMLQWYRRQTQFPQSG